MLKKISLFLWIKMDYVVCSKQNSFFFKAMFGKNSIFPKTKTVKTGLMSVCQTHA
jgi:hypothetical protein